MTGNTEIIEHEVIIGADNGITVFRNGDNELRLEDNDKKRNLPLLRLSEVNPLSLNSPSVCVERINNILVVKYGAERTHRVDGFSIETGNLIWTINKIFNSVPILLNSTIVSFDMDNRLELYNVETGALIGSARFTATTTENGDTTGLSVWLAGNSDVVSILMQNTKDLLTVRISDIPTLE